MSQGTNEAGVILVSFLSAMVTPTAAVQLDPAGKIRFVSRKQGNRSEGHWVPLPAAQPGGGETQHNKRLIVLVVNWRLVWLRGEQMLGRLTVVAI